LALLLTLSMAQFMVVLDLTIVNVALPSIQDGLGLHVATMTLQWLVSGYAVAFGGFLLLAGRLADTYGRARLYRIGLVAFVVASMAGGLAVEPGLLIASRVVQGIGAAMLAPAGLSLLVTSWSDQKERSHALGIYGAIASAGFASGAVLGGLLVEVTWRLVFFVNVPVGVALLVASFRLLPPDPPSSRGQLDVPGAILVTAGVSLLVFAVARAGDTLRVTQPAVIAAAAILLLGRCASWMMRCAPGRSTTSGCPTSPAGSCRRQWISRSSAGFRSRCRCSRGATCWPARSNGRSRPPARPPGSACSPGPPWPAGGWPASAGGASRPGRHPGGGERRRGDADLEPARPVRADLAGARRGAQGGRRARRVPGSGGHRVADGPVRRLVGDPRRPEHGPADRQHGRGRADADADA
jgi:MFS family permease